MSPEGDIVLPREGEAMPWVAVILFIVVVVTVLPTVTNAETPRCHVYGVSDGDTIRVRCGDGDQLKVRLAEIDAPEKAQAFGKAAKDQLSDLVYGYDVSLEVVDTDRYGRIVALVEANGINVNRQMLQLGMAWCYTQYAKHDWCAQSQTSAQSAKIGLWAAPEPTPPWEYRRREKR